MALDRNDALKRAEKLLRQGRLEAAIDEYVRVVEDQPGDWTTANTLGDLYVRAGLNERAAAQYVRIADHFVRDGSYPNAAALYKKILKISPDDEVAQLQLADMSVKQGLLAEAKAILTSVVSRRRARGDRAGAAEVVLRLASLDPADIDASLAAARAAEEKGDGVGAAALFRAVHTGLMDNGRTRDALAALANAVRLNPADREGRVALARAAVAARDFDTARAYLDRATAGSDPGLLIALAEMELRSGRLDEARALLPHLLALDRRLRDDVIELAWTMADRNPTAAYVCIDAVVAASVATSDFADAATVLQEFLTRVPAHIPALAKLIDMCVDGGLEGATYDAQAQLADAYLAAGQGSEARGIAEDLIAREPWERAHIDRFRRALIMLHVADPDTIIAERLSGQRPFTATDLFSGHDDVPPPAVPRAPARPPGPTPIDLSGVLGDVRGVSAAQPAAPVRENLEQVFEDLREHSARQQGSDEAAEQMNVAQRYLQMGLTEEAIASLKSAARSPRQRFAAGVTLGRLYKGRGDVAHAIEWMERAAEAPAPTADEGRSLLYDLGVTLEEAGESARALAVFLELQADAGEYRDVGPRVDRLSRVQTGG